MPKFPKNTGFKLPGMGSKEIDTPGNFRKDQKVEDVGYCDNTESHMLPPGSSPLLASDEPKDWLVPDYYHTTYTSSVGDDPQEERDTVETVNEITPRDVDLPPPPEITADIPDIPTPPPTPQPKEGGLKSYAKAWADNDSGIQQMYNNDFNAYVTDVSGQGETATKAAKRKKATEGGFIWDEDIHKLK